MLKFIQKLYEETLFDEKSLIEAGKVHYGCGYLSAKCKVALEETLRRKGISVHYRDGKGDHRSLVLHEDGSDKPVTVDVTISQFIPSMKGEVFIGNDDTLMELIQKNGVTDPYNGEKRNLNADTIFNLLYGDKK